MRCYDRYTGKSAGGGQGGAAWHLTVLTDGSTHAHGGQGCQATQAPLAMHEP